MESNQSQPQPNRLLNEHEVAELRHQSVATIRRERLKKTGIRALKLGGSVRYRYSDVIAWIDSRPTIGGGVTA
jgi:predicted DNA-binding transcriptional regulator AlpA